APATMAAPFSLYEFWPPDEHEAVRRAEALIGAREATGAVLACDVLLTRTLAAAANILADGTPPATIALLLGIEGPRYLAFVAAVRAARARGLVTVEQSLDCYALALDARRALWRV